ncbi:quinone oxidoreductase family protein [Nocardioides euryhalodurans]|uniref:Zinc-binding alcohol dehydrogenase family protein n=1 Tax=Nocardioides euryhalodurans TaxID=2518370 RepID=A0A4P7GMA8_9ACTN|nr:zinc-binding alcohol dehydrogenase family protein [Nocardioides euryhalodurans]QBR93143.1 zinc-binding alcohol dehydrogenase family protein [Nocardioides euryhalodurans]
MTGGMRAAAVREVGSPPLFGTFAYPDRATTVPPRFPIEHGDAPARPPSERASSLVAVTCAALNPIDLHVASGGFFQGPPQVPYVPGVEGVGRVLESDHLPAGTRVRFELGHPGYGGNGALAEQVVVDDESMVELPASVADDDAAALGVAGITAARALDLADLGAGEGVLVLGATGAVGAVAVQLARLRGAGRVVAAGRNPEQLRRAVAVLGADAAVELDGRSVADLAAAFREAAGGGVDVVVDPLWGEPAVAALAAGNLGVRLVNVGQAAGTSVEMPSVPLRGHRAVVRAISTAMDDLSLRRERYSEVLGHLAAGRLLVDHVTRPLEDVAEAWAAQASSPGRRLLLRVRPDSG